MADRFTPDEITYELFGIDPAEFYRLKFAHGRGPENALDNPFSRYEIGYEGIRRLIADLRAFLPDGAGSWMWAVARPPTARPFSRIYRGFCFSGAICRKSV